MIINLSFLGKGVKVAVFDTGLQKSHPHLKNVKDRTDWTDEKKLADGKSILPPAKSLNNSSPFLNISQF